MPDSLGSTTRRKWPLRLGIGLGAAFLLYVAGLFVLTRFLDPEALATWLEPRAERVLNRDVELSRVELGFFPLRVGLRDITVSDPTGLAPTLARVASVDLRIGVLPLFHKEVRVHRLSVDGLEADLQMAADGRSNFGDLSTGGAEDPSATGGEAGSGEDSATPFTVDLQGLRVTDGTISFHRESDTLQVEVANFQLRASARGETDGSWLFAGSSDSELNLRRGGSAPLLDGTPVELAFDLRTDADFDSVSIRTGELKFQGVALALSGEVRDLKDPIRSVALSLSGQGLPLSDLLAALPASIREDFPAETDGLLGVDLRVEGEAGSGRIPAIRGNVTLAQGRVTYEGDELAEGLSADLALEDNQSVRTRLRGSVLGGPLSIDGVVALSGEREMDLTVLADLDLERMGPFLKLQDGVSAAGRLAIQTRIMGPATGFQGLRFNGEVKPASVRLTHPSLAVPVELPGGSLQLTGIRGILQDFPLTLGEDHLSISGEIPDFLAFLDPGASRRVEGVVRGPRLDLRKISSRPVPDSSLTYGKVAFAKLGGRLVGGRSIADVARELGLARPDSLPFAGSLELQLDTVIDRQGRMEGVHANVEFGPDFVQLTDAVLRRFGGEIRTSADLTLGSGAATSFSLDLQVLDLDAGSFLSETTPLGRYVRGRITVTLDLVGTLDNHLLPDRPALVGSGSFSLVGGGLTSMPVTRGLADFLGMESLREPSIQDWSTSFVLENGGVGLAETTVQGAPGTPRIGGTVGLDGGLDLLSVFALPSERLSAAALERLGVAGQFAANVLSRPEVVQAVLRVGGSVLDPSIQVDPRAAALTLGAAVEAEVRSEVQEQIDTQRAEAQRVLQEQQAEAQRRIDEQKQQLKSRATGFLRNLGGRRDTVTVPPPPDTTPAVIPIRDTIPGVPTGMNPVPPDTAPPDTLRPDTLRPEGVQADSARTDSLPPDTLGPDTARPDTTRPDTTRPDTVRPDTIRRTRPGGDGQGAGSGEDQGAPEFPEPVSIGREAPPKPSSNAETAARTVRTALR